MDFRAGLVHNDSMIEAIAAGVAVAFLGWAWLVARRGAEDCIRRSAERRAERAPTEQRPALRNPLNGPTPYEEKLSRITSGMNSTAQPRY